MAEADLSKTLPVTVSVLSTSARVDLQHRGELRDDFQAGIVTRPFLPFPLAGGFSCGSVLSVPVNKNANQNSKP